MKALLKRSKITLLVWLAILGISESGIAQYPNAETIAEIDKLFEPFANPETPGVVVGFVQSGEMIFAKGYGMADLEHEIAISDVSVFSTASVSKQFTAFAILLLEAEGKLSLDDDIRKHLPDFNSCGETITLRMLATHTSGIRSHLNLLGMRGYTPDNVVTKEDVHSVIYRQKGLNFIPGTRFRYSNSGYFLLAEIVEKVSGQSFPDYVQENILTPLGMEHSFVMDDYHKLVHNRACSYELINGAYVNAPANYSYYGSTNLYTTLEDLKRWALNFQEPKVGNAAILKRMTTLTELRNGMENPYAMGVFVEQFNGLTMIHHSGADAGYRAFLGIFPEQKVAVILLSNNSRIYAQGMALQMADLFLRDQYPEPEEKAPEQAPKAFLSLSAKKLKQFAGNYLNTENFITRNIILRDDTLWYSRPEQNNRETQLHPISPNSFQLGPYQDLTILFEGKKAKTMKILEKGKEDALFEAFQAQSYSAAKLKAFEGMYYSEELDTKYELKVVGEQLTVSHPKLGLLALDPIKADVFSGSSWQFRSLEIERDGSGAIAGFLLSSNRAKGVAFSKIKAD